MRLLRFLLPLLALVFMASSRKSDINIRFHTEANPVSGSEFTSNTTLPNSDRKITIAKIAAISENDVVSIFPFPADNGTQGCAFKLDQHGRIALDTLSQENKGSLLIGFYNGRLVSAVLIDRHDTKGVVYIASGLKAEEIEKLKKHFPVLGEKKSKKKKKESKPTAQIDPNATPAPVKGFE